MRVLITGSSNGIGLATAVKFLNEGHSVFGFDIKTPPDKLFSYKYFYPIIEDVRNVENFPSISDINIVINNAGVQNSDDDISTNLMGTINITEFYGLNPQIVSIMNMASVSAHNGAEFGRYVASKGGVLAYTKWTAKEIAKWGATCNSLSFGGVSTDLNKPVMDDQGLWDHIMDMTPLKKWMTPEECAEWIYFFTVNNKSCSGQDLIIDNLETLNHTFVW